MEDFIVRLSSLTLKNIKNVKNGTIFMPMANEKPVDSQAATGAVIGIDHGHEHGMFAQFARMGL